MTTATASRHSAASASSGSTTTTGLLAAMTRSLASALFRSKDLPNRSAKAAPEKRSMTALASSDRP
jgi:hypothetical protein